MKKFCCLILLAAFLAFPTSLFSQAEPPRELFAQAYQLFSRGSLPEAEDLFLKGLAQDYVLADYNLYFLGMIASTQGKPDAARNHFLQLKRRFPQSLWAPHAALELAKISLAEKNYSEAMDELRALLTAANRNDASHEALYRMAQVHELREDLKQAQAAYQELRRTGGQRWAETARKELTRLRQQQPDLFAPMTPERVAEEAELLFRERQFQDAEALYRKLLELAPQTHPRPQLLKNLADVYQAARKREDEIAVLTEIIQEYPESPEAPASLYRLARAYWNRNDNLKALDHLRQFKERYPKSPTLDYVDFISARIYESLGRPNDAKGLYSGFADRFPASRWREDAQWRLAWIHYLQAEDSPARTLFKKLAEDSTEGNYKTAALYWQARTAERMGYTEEAKRLYHEIASGDDDSYYMGPATKRLQQIGGAVKERKAKPSPAPESTPRLSSQLSFHFGRARELSEMRLNRLAVAELDQLKQRGGGERSVRLVLMREYARNHAYDRSVALANETGLSTKEAGEYRYPLAYWDLIQRKAAQQEMDPYLVVALIRQESLFDPTAVSTASAHGLMQLLPSTAVRMAAQLGLPSPKAQNLFDPELNITLGIHHLKELLRLYSNSVFKALAAYNAGVNAVANWEKSMASGDEEEFVERIPYGETRLYIKLVLRNHLNYKKLYASRDKANEKEERP